MSFALGIELAAFVVGLLLGSFLNVCIARLPEHRSVVRPGSACMACGRPIRWYDNVPVLSWVSDMAYSSEPVLADAGLGAAARLCSSAGSCSTLVIRSSAPVLPSM